MKHTSKKLPGSQIELTVTLEDKEFAGYYETAETKAAGEVTIKGFRKGAAPKEMVAGALDHEKVFKNALNEAVRWSLDAIKQENEWTLIDQPRIEITKADPGKGIEYTAVITTFPEIKLGNYKRAAAKILSEKKPVVVEETDINKTLEWIRGSRATEARVVRGAQMGDLVEVDIATEQDEKPVPGASFNNDRFILGESNFIAGFDKQLEGKKENEVVKFSIVAPADYWQKELQGKQLDFTVTMRGVFERALPELTDEFAAGLGPKFKTVADLKASVRDGLTMEREEKENEKVRIKALDAIAKDAAIDLPEILVERTLDSMTADMGRMMASSAKATEAKQADFQKDLRERMRERALLSVRHNLVMHQIVKEEGLAPTEAELLEEAKRLGVDLENQYDYVYSVLQNKKVFEFLEKQA